MQALDGGGHGTHVAGIAAAATNNGVGIAGVDWHSRIHPKRVDNIGGYQDVYQAIVDAVDHSSNVLTINNSYGLWNHLNDEPAGFSATVALAFAYAYKANRISVAAMGNHQSTHPGAQLYPAGYGNVIAVGATNNSDDIAYFSVHGNHIDVCAPGVDILSTLNGGFGFMSGTSMATPHVSGIVSLLKGFMPQLANDDIRSIIRLSADTTRGMNGQDFHPAYGYGRANAARALELLQEPFQLKQWSVTGGTSVGSTSSYQIQFMGVSGLASANYIVKRHEVRKTVTFPSVFYFLEGAWGRGVSTTGWSQSNPNFGEGFCEIVPGTLSNTGATLRSYVYQVWNMAGQYFGYFPATPANVNFSYSVLGIPNPTVSGPSTVCTSNAVFTLNNLPEGCTITWSHTPSLLTYVSGQGTSNYTVQAASSSAQGAGFVEATITGNCGSFALRKDIWIGSPLQSAGIPGFEYDGKEFLTGSFYNFWALFNPAQGNFDISYTFDWSITGGTILFGQGENMILVQTDPTTVTIPFNLGVRIGNSCGFSPWFWRYGYVIDSGSGGSIYYSVFPNPARDEITIAVQERTLSESPEKLISELIINNVRILDKMGKSVILRNFPGAETSVKLNISFLPKGIYIVRINDRESHTILKD